MNLHRRVEVIRKIIEISPLDSAIFATTGETAREALSIGSGGRRFFPCVGGMGHASSVALGFAKQTTDLTICLDGDGALLMHLGSLPSITSSNNVKFLHFLFDNGCHLSVGGNITSGRHLEYTDLAKSMGYKSACELVNLDQLSEIFQRHQEDEVSTQFIHVKVHPKREKDLPRPEHLSVFIDSFRKKWD
jgi:phosphonopyruvate decarboxylase